MEIILLLLGLLLLVILLRRLGNLIAITRKKNAARIEAEKENAHIAEIKTKLSPIAESSRQKIYSSFQTFNKYVYENLNEILPKDSVKRINETDENQKKVESSARELIQLIEQEGNIRSFSTKAKNFPFGENLSRLSDELIEQKKRLIRMETDLSAINVTLAMITEMEHMYADKKNNEFFKKIISNIGDAALDYEEEMSSQVKTYGEIAYQVFPKMQNLIPATLIKTLNIPEFNEKYAQLIAE